MRRAIVWRTPGAGKRVAPGSGADVGAGTGAASGIGEARTVSGAAARRSAWKRAVAALAGLVALALAVVTIVAGVAAFSLAAGKSRYDAGEFAASAQAYDVATHVMPDSLGRWKAFFGAGTARLTGGEAAAAISDLERALELVPPGTSRDEGGVAEANPDVVAEDTGPTDECKVRINLAVATMSVAGGESDPQFTAAGYADAVRIIAPCEDEQSEKVRTQAEESQAEAEEEAARQEAERHEEGDQEPDAGEAGDQNSEPMSEQDRELLERISEAEQQRREWSEYDKQFGSKNGENW
mgnify:CR=1 FL=1